MKYRLKTNCRVTCEVTVVEGCKPGRPWYMVSGTDDRLHGFTFKVPAWWLDQAWEPVPEEKPAESALAIEDELDGLAETWATRAETVGREPLPAFARRAAAEIRRLRKDVDDARELCAISNCDKRSDGKTILDFYEVWLSQAHDQARRFQAGRDAIQAQRDSFSGALDACHAALNEAGVGGESAAERIGVLAAERDRIAAELEVARQAVGLATTSIPNMEITPDDPIGMMHRVVAETTNLRAMVEELRKNLKHRDDTLVESYAENERLRKECDEHVAARRQIANALDPGHDLMVSEIVDKIRDLREDVGHWRATATGYGNMVHGCSPALEAAGFPVDGAQFDGAVGGVRRAVEALAADRDRLRTENAELRKARPINCCRVLSKGDDCDCTLCRLEREDDRLRAENAELRKRPTVEDTGADIDHFDRAKLFAALCVEPDPSESRNSVSYPERSSPAQALDASMLVEYIAGKMLDPAVRQNVLEAGVRKKDTEPAMSVQDGLIADLEARVKALEQRPGSMDFWLQKPRKVRITRHYDHHLGRYSESYEATIEELPCAATPSPH